MEITIQLDTIIKIKLPTHPTCIKKVSHYFEIIIKLTKPKIPKIAITIFRE
jgi:hypothetical protein